MNNRTRVFDAQFEIELLKKQIEFLKQDIENIKLAKQVDSLRTIPGYSPPVYGPLNLDWWKIISSAETPQAIKDLFESNGKETK